MTAVRQAGAIAWANVLRLSRDRLGLFFIVVLPLLIILLFGVASAANQSAAAVGVASSSRGELHDSLIDRLRSEGAIEIRSYATRESLETDVRRRVVAAGVVVPDSYDDQVRSGTPLPLELLVDPSGTAPAAVRTTLAGAIAAENVRLQTAQFAVADLGLSFDEALRLADDAEGSDSTVVRVEAMGESVQGATPVDRSAAANLVLFVFITSLVGSAALIESRRLGVTRRMLAGPLTPGVILSGEALGRFAIAIVQALIVIAGASLLFGAQWQDPAAVWVVVVLLSLVGTGAAMLMGAVFSNAEQASGVAVPLGIGLGMLGGCMWPLEIVPPAMRALGHVTPHAWAMDALGAILQDGAGVADVGPQLLVLTGFAAVLLITATWRLRRVLHAPTGQPGKEGTGMTTTIPEGTTDSQDISRAELALATRNAGMPLEALTQDITPLGLHYLLIHYDVPFVEPSEWRLTIDGNVDTPAALTLDDVRARPSVTVPVTLECAGNGRTLHSPRAISQPWGLEAVGTGEWTGTPLAPVLREAGLREDTVDFVFTGIDRGVEGGSAQNYQRSLGVEDALRDEVLLAYELNGVPLPPQHGYPVRLLVPGWYGMASVKWLTQISAVTEPFTGYQMVKSYRLRQRPEDEGTPLNKIAVRSLIAPPGIPEFATRIRHVPLRGYRLEGKAWSGHGPIERVEVSDDGGATWTDAEVGAAAGMHAWHPWSFQWQPKGPGPAELCSRATDAAGNTQPDRAEWNLGGYAGNGVHRVAVTVDG